MGYRVGVDIGGTFIDFCVFDEAAQALTTLKVLTTPANPGAEIMTGLDRLWDAAAIDPKDIESFVHGSTIGVNTVIQRKGARMALFATENFSDVLEVARLRMAESYSLFSSRPEPLITRERVFGVSERLYANGGVLRPLQEASVLKALAQARAKNVDGIIVSLLHGFRNPIHEQAVADIIRREAPELFVFTSSEIWPVIREYERTTTAVINGYIHPRIDAYLTSLEMALIEKGVSAKPLVTKSNGGVMSVANGKKSCVNMVLSGTASGVMGGAFVAKSCGVKDAITLDIGGTSSDVAVIIDGAPQFGMGEKIGEFPLYIPSISVTSIGDGGGSLAWVDEFGVLKIGPESAGSDPGPACYGKGGTQATITDAFAVCGFLGHRDLAYESVHIDQDLAVAAVQGVAQKMDRDVVGAAEAIIEIAVSGMYMELNKIAARYGVDIRDFALVPFGGAGPMLGCFLARELGMARIVIPARPGVVSALGGLIADLKNDFVRTLLMDVTDAAVAPLKDALQSLSEQAGQWLQEEQGYNGDVVNHVSADMCYAGQSFEIEIPLQAAWIVDSDIDAVSDAFHRRHDEIYDFCDREGETRIVNLRLVTVGDAPKPVLKKIAIGFGPAQTKGAVRVWFDGAYHQAALIERGALRAGQTISGPAVIAQSDTTICVPNGFSGVVDAVGNIILTAENLA